MNLDLRKFRKNMKAKGFVEIRGRNHVYHRFQHNGIDTNVSTHVSHGGNSKDISNDLISFMAGQCKLTRMEFVDLANCPLSREEYEKILKDKGEIRRGANTPAIHKSSIHPGRR